MERADLALGGAERSVFELADAVSQLRQDVHILAAKARAETANLHILCQDAPGKRVRFVTFEKTLKKHLSENQYDIIHSVLPFSFADVYQPRGGAYAESILRNAASYQKSSQLLLTSAEGNSCGQSASCVTTRTAPSSQPFQSTSLSNSNNTMDFLTSVSWSYPTV